MGSQVRKDPWGTIAIGSEVPLLEAGVGQLSGIHGAPSGAGLEAMVSGRPERGLQWPQRSNDQGLRSGLWRF